MKNIKDVKESKDVKELKEQPVNHTQTLDEQTGILAKFSAKGDALKWSLVAVLIIAAIAADFYYGQVAAALRISVGIVVTLLALGIAALTRHGQIALAFLNGARTELRKVVWPTRQETIQTTGLVVVFVLVMSLILWGIDSLLLWFIAALTGH